MNFKFSHHPVRNSLILSLTFIILLGIRNVLIRTPPAPFILTAPVLRGDLEDVVLATGIIQPLRQVDVGAQVSGQLKKIHVDVGDNVVQGQLLAEIDPQLIANDLNASKASLDGLLAQKKGKIAQLQQAQTELKRQQRMRLDDATSEKDLLNAKTSVEMLQADMLVLEAQIRQEQFRVDKDKTNLSYTRIIAPMTGKVLSIITKEGQTIIASQQAPVILQLADLSQVTVTAQVSEADIIRIKPGLSVYFTILGDPDKRYTGTLRTIQPIPETVNNAIFYNVLFDVPNLNETLRVKMTAQVSILLQGAKNVLNIPVSALVEQHDTDHYIVKVLLADNKIEDRDIRVGLRTPTNIQVLEGLEENERVITNSLSDNSTNQTEYR